MKIEIDTWYSSNESNMTSYTSYLEDTPWCNDRSIYQLNGWNPNGGDTTKYLYFGVYGRIYESPKTPDLTCNINDAFTLPGNSQGNGKLQYPVGLLTGDEIRLAGGGHGLVNTSYYLYNDDIYLALLSPAVFNINSAWYWYISDALNYFNNSAKGVRPAISLRQGIKFSSGYGTSNSPYVVEENN